MIPALRRAARLPLLTLLLVAGLVGLALMQPWLPQQGRRVLIRWWSCLLMRICGVKVQETWAGDPAQPRTLAELAPGRLLVANHVSWLDIFAINSLATSAFVAKAEIKRWPVIGWLVSLAGTVYIARGNRRAVPDVLRQMRERLRTGFPVALFPEGTTNAGPELKPFHGNLLQAAIDEEAEIVPVGLKYLHADGTPGVEAYYLDETTFMQSLWAVVGAKGLVVKVVVLDAVPSGGRERRELGERVRERIGEGLLPRWG